MTGSLLRSIYLLMFIGMCLASWDGPVQTIEREETIPQQSIHEHIQHNMDESPEDVNDIRENKIEPVLVLTPAPKIPAHVSATASPTAAISSFVIVAVACGFML